MDEESDGGAYNSVPSVFFSYMLLWIFSATIWILHAYQNRQFQLSKLLWIVAAVPFTKAVHLTISFLFWYSCICTNACSLWMSFGVYTSGMIFQTATFVSFLVISHGYCITCSRLSLSERRAMTALACLLYLSLVGHRASLPYFSGMVLVNYMIFFYYIFHYVSQNLLVLKQQLNFIQDQHVRTMHDAIIAKYIMFKKFRGVMHVAAVWELGILLNMDHSTKNYWLRVWIREWTQLLIFLYIGNIFRFQESVPRFSVMPIVKCNNVETMVPPIFSIEMDAKTFQGFTTHDWHIGVPTMTPKFHKRTNMDDDHVIVMIQHPHASPS